MSIEIVAFLWAALGAGSVAVNQLTAQLLAADQKQEGGLDMSQIRCSRLHAPQALRLDPAQMARMLAAMGIEVQQGTGQISNVYGAHAEADLVVTKWQGQSVPTNQLGLKRQADGSWSFLSGVGGLAQLAVGRVRSTIEQGLQTAQVVNEALQVTPEFRLVEQEGKRYATLTLASVAGTKTDQGEFSLAGVKAKTDSAEMTVTEQQAADDEALRLVKGIAEAIGLQAVQLSKPDAQVAPGTLPGLALQLPSGALAGVRQEGGKLEIIAPSETVSEELKVVAHRVVQAQKFEFTLHRLAAETQEKIELQAYPLVKGLTAEQVVTTLSDRSAVEALGITAVDLGNLAIYPGTVPGVAFKTPSGKLVALRQTREGRVELVAPKSVEKELSLTLAALNAQGTLRQAQKDPRLRGLTLDWSSLRVEEGEVVLEYVDKGAITAPRTAQLGNLKQVIVGGVR